MSSKDRSEEHRKNNADSIARHYVVKNGSLGELNPELAEEWDFTKNFPLTPFQVALKSNRKYFWLCKSFGHSWERSAKHRSKGRGCPVCANRVILRGFNDLESLNPTLALEWHPQLNGNLTPSEVGIGSNKNVWWICENNHEWSTSPNHRKLTGCPFCVVKDSRLELILVNFLRDFYPDLSFIRRSKIVPSESNKSSKLELDVYLPELKLAFEVQDFATHDRYEDNLPGRYRAVTLIKKGPKYHELKRWLAEKYLGVFIVDLWEDELMDKSFQNLVSKAIEEAASEN